MIPTTMKWVSIIALCLLLVLLWVSGSNQAALLAGFVVCVGAFVVMLDAFRVRRYIWATTFAVIVLVFNPIIDPIFPQILPRSASAVLYAACIVAFAGSVAYSKTLPRLSIASITETSPRSEAL